MSNCVWILTSEVNDYDQFGEYFDAVFFHQPTRQELINAGVPFDKVEHILNGGGRVKHDRWWWYLRKHCNEG